LFDVRRHGLPPVFNYRHCVTVTKQIFAHF
jgi:hypothetical protein